MSLNRGCCFRTAFCKKQPTGNNDGIIFGTVGICLQCLLFYSTKALHVKYRFGNSMLIILPPRQRKFPLQNKIFVLQLFRFLNLRSAKFSRVRRTAAFAAFLRAALPCLRGEAVHNGQKQSVGRTRGVFRCLRRVNTAKIRFLKRGMADVLYGSVDSFE